MTTDTFFEMMNPLIDSYLKIANLLTTCDSDIIPVDGLKNNLNMKKKEIIAKHKEKFSIWQASDGRWKTKLPDPTKPEKKRPIAKVNLEDLEDAIVAWYTTERTPDTLERLYPEWISYKAKDTTAANAHKLSWVWDKYYTGEAIISRPLTSLDVLDVKKWLLEMIEKHSLNQKQYKEMKSVINQLLDYAVEKRIVSFNVSRNISRISAKHFSVKVKKPASEQVYMTDEKADLIKICEEMFEKTGNTAYLAICLNFFLGLRVGELVALKVTDFSDLFVHIEREEIKTYREENGKFVRKGYAIAPYTKTPDSVRDVPLTSEARKYVKRIIDHNHQNGFTSEFILLNKQTGERMHNDGINNTLRRANRKLVTPQKGNHGIRKTYISTLVAYSDLTDEEIRMAAGHKYISTTQNSYMYSVQRPETRVVEFEKALGKNVTPCYLNSVKKENAGNA